MQTKKKEVIKEKYGEIAMVGGSRSIPKRTDRVSL